MASLDQLNQDMAAALRDGESTKVATLRLLISSVKNEQIKLGKQLDEEAVIKVLAREAKQRRDSIAAYEQANRDDLVKNEQSELTIIETYLPQSLPEAELDQLITSVIKEVGATSPAQMGVVIGAVMQRAAGRADGSVVSQKVRQQLTG